VTTFLAWAASPEMDDRKLMGIKGLTVIGVMWLFAIYQKRLRCGTAADTRCVANAPPPDMPCVANAPKMHKTTQNYTEAHMKGIWTQVHWHALPLGPF
jgi:ubiquinol-cytochrome c reductase cytochrome c1 subunit